MLSFPLWVIRLPKRSPQGVYYAADAGGYIFVFNSRDASLEFLLKRIQPGWVTHLLQRDEAVLLSADMHQNHIPGVCLNPRPDDLCGEVLSIDSFVAAVHVSGG